MQVLTVVQCDSMDSDDLQTIQRSILQKEGPTLGQVYSPKIAKPFVQLTAGDFIKSLPDRAGKEIKYIGNSQQSMFRAYYYILLHVDLQQRRFYPHLRSIIKQQLNKDYILRRQLQDDQILRRSKDKRINPFSNRVRKDSRDKVCDMYFQIVHNYTKIQDFIMRNPRFDGTCMNMIINLVTNKNKYMQILQIEINEDDNASRDKGSIRKSDRNDRNSDTVSKQSKKSTKSTKSVARNFSDDFNFLSKVFNVDYQVVKQQKIGFSAYRIGFSKKFFIINESGHIFVVLLGLLLGNSGRKNSNNDSEIISNASTPLLPQVIQASQQSTPKFIEGHESSIRYRKKSHKNSFGGDVQIVSYKDLNASFHQLRASKDKREIEKIIIENSKKKIQKVFSQRFQAQQMGDLEQVQDEEGSKNKNTASNKNNDGQKQQIQVTNKSPKKNIVGTKPMRKSHCEPALVSFESFLQQRGKHGQEKVRKMQDSKISMNSSRKKKMSNSACLQAEQAQKLAIFNNKVSFSKHDRIKFELGSQQPPQRQQQSIYNQSNGLSQGIKQIKNQLLNKHYHDQNFENSRNNLEMMVLGINRNIVDSKIQQLPQQQFDRSQGSAEDTNKQFLRDGNDGFNIQGMTSEAIIQMLQPSVRQKLQNRKFSYVSHKKFSARENQLRQLNKSDKKNTSQDIIWQKNEIEKSKFENKKPTGKQRFEENPFTMSDLDRSNSTTPAPVPSSHQRLKQKKLNFDKCKLVSQVVQYSYESRAQAEPAGWIRKEVVYFFSDKAPQRKVLLPVHRNINYNRNLASKNFKQIILGSTDRKNRPYLYNLVEGRANMKKSINQYTPTRHQRHSLADPIENLFEVRSNESYSAKKVIQMATKVLSPPIRSANSIFSTSNYDIHQRVPKQRININGNSGHTNNTNKTMNAFHQNGNQNSYNQLEQQNRRKASVSLSVYSNMATYDAKLYHKTRKNTTSNNFISVIKQSVNQQNGTPQTTAAILNDQMRSNSKQSLKQHDLLRMNTVHSGRNRTPEQIDQKESDHNKINQRVQEGEGRYTGKRSPIAMLTTSNTFKNKSKAEQNNSITNLQTPNKNQNQNKFRPYPNLPINSPNRNVGDEHQRIVYNHGNTNNANFVAQSFNQIQNQGQYVNRVYNNITPKQTINNLYQLSKGPYNHYNKTQASPNQILGRFAYNMNEKISQRSHSPNTQNNSKQKNNGDLSNKETIHYSTSLQHLVLQVSPKIGQLNTTVKNQLPAKVSNPQSRTKPQSTNTIHNYVYQPRTHRGSINFVITNANQKHESRQLRRISPQQSRASNNASAISNNAFNPANQNQNAMNITVDGIRPPSNTGTVSSRSNTNRENLNYVYYKR